MVDVKFSLGKRDFVWIVLLIGVAVVGFGYSYGGSNPSVMGHSASEIEVDNAFCNRIVGHDCGYDEAGGGAIVMDLVNGQHSSSQCTSVGGVVMDDDPDGLYCKLPGNCATYGWAQFKSWRQTASKTCTGCGHSTSPTKSCNTGSSWKNGPFETCIYRTESCVNLENVVCSCNVDTTCTATRASSGCY